MKTDPFLLGLMGGVLALLIGWVLARRCGPAGPSPTIQNLNARIRAWWVMVSVFGGVLLWGETVTLVLFGFVSFLALREFITLTPTRGSSDPWARNGARHSILHSILLVEKWGSLGPEGSTADFVQLIC